MPACLVEWWKKLCGESIPACCEEGNRLDFLPCPLYAPFLFRVQFTVPIEEAVLVQEG